MINGARARNSHVLGSELQKVKGQGHMRPKIHLEAWRRYLSRPPWVKQLSLKWTLAYHYHLPLPNGHYHIKWWSFNVIRAEKIKVYSPRTKIL